MVARGYVLLLYQNIVVVTAQLEMAVAHVGVGNIVNPFVWVTNQPDVEMQ